LRGRYGEGVTRRSFFEASAGNEGRRCGVPGASSHRFAVPTQKAMPPPDGNLNFADLDFERRIVGEPGFEAT